MATDSSVCRFQRKVGLQNEKLIKCVSLGKVWELLKFFDIFSRYKDVDNSQVTDELPDSDDACTCS